jgi:hypothetical protein
MFAWDKIFENGYNKVIARNSLAFGGQINLGYILKT